MQEKKIQLNVDHLKPEMKSLGSVDEIPFLEGRTILTAKLDGEFNVATINKEECTLLNRWGHLRADFPALNELGAAIKSRISQAVLLCELYAVDESGRPTQLPEMIHIAKGSREYDRLRLGVFDLVSVEGEKVNGDYEWKIEEISTWLDGCKLAQPAPHVKPRNKEEMKTFWDWCMAQGYEGVVARVGTETYKIKPARECDAVIIAINKRELLEQHKVTSFKVALMDQEGLLIELSDVASGINHELRDKLWGLTEYRVGEDSEAIWIKPFVLVTVEYQETFEAEKRRFRFDGSKYVDAGKAKLVSLRHPRLKMFRRDKKVNPGDLRLSQVLLEEDK